LKDSKQLAPELREKIYGELDAEAPGGRQGFAA
jgi:ribonuclease HII